MKEKGLNGFLEKMYNHLLENFCINYVLNEEYNYISNINDFEKIGKDELLIFKKLVKNNGIWW